MSDDDKYGELPKMEIRIGGTPNDPEPAEPENEPAAPEPDRDIIETAIDLTPASSADAVAATERLRAAKGQTGRARGREGVVAAADEPPAAAETAERAEIPESPVLERGAKKRYTRAITLWLIAAVLGGLAAVLAWHPGAVGTENKAFADAGETSQVMSQLSTLACVPFKYTWQTITEDMQHAGEVLVGQARAEYERTAEATRSMVVQRQADSDCQVDHLALADLSRDRASAIGVLVIQVSAGGKLIESLMPRMQFNLERVGDDWKIAYITDVK